MDTLAQITELLKGEDSLDISFSLVNVTLEQDPPQTVDRKRLCDMFRLALHRTDCSDGIIAHLIDFFFVSASADSTAAHVLYEVSRSPRKENAFLIDKLSEHITSVSVRKALLQSVLDGDAEKMSFFIKSGYHPLYSANTDEYQQILYNVEKSENSALVSLLNR